MADETTKQLIRRCCDHRFASRWFVGIGIDIGCGKDPLSKHSDVFTLIKSVRPWDLPDGDAMLMDGVADNSFDFVHSSHCLEHLTDPLLALKNWLRICKKGGHLIITVPDEDLYEQGLWPSTFNSDHKWTFTILKSTSWSPKSINLVNLLEKYQDSIEILKIEKLDSSFKYSQPRYDQTLHGYAESAIEFVLKKITAAAPTALDEGVRFASVVRASEIQDLLAKAIKSHQSGQSNEAKGCYEAVLNAAPDNLTALNNLALLSPAKAAEMLLRKALSIDNNFRDAKINLAVNILNSGNYHEANELFISILNADPNDNQAIMGLTQVYEKLNDFQAAIELINDKLACFDKQDFPLFLLGKYYESLGQTDEALAHLERCLQINPDHVEAHIYAGRQWLKKGNFVLGAKNIEWIWHGRIPESQIGMFTDETGKIIRQDNRIILLSSDSGLGDTLQFIRYGIPLKDIGARVIVECQPELERLLKNMPEVSNIYPSGKVTEKFDVRVPLHNLIGAFRTTIDNIPSDVPYLRAYPDEITRYQERIKQFGGLKVGLCWSGNPTLPRNASRSIQPALLAPLFEIPGVVFFSLQKGVNATELKLIDWTGEFEDMSCTAALVENLDLVISVDSVVAHLAGALGRPVWLLNRFDSCWRWLEDRTDSPWYPGLTQFRQPVREQWDDVIEAVQEQLNYIVAQNLSLDEWRQNWQDHL